jgi:hypothetical protein
MNFQNLQYFPLTWVDGMFLNTGHFQHTENYIEESLRDTRLTALYAGNYGLLPNAPIQLQPTTIAAGQVELRLHACRGILPSGHRVEILPPQERTHLPCDTPFGVFAPMFGVRYSIYLCVDTCEKTAVGYPVERPLRHPYWMQKLYLEIIPINQISSNTPLKIGEWENNQLIATYIPPTLTLWGNEALKAAHQDFQYKLGKLVEKGMSVITKSNEPMRIQFCQSLLQIIQNQLGTYQWQLPYQSPMAWVAYFGNLGYSVDVLLKISNKDFIKTTLMDGQLHQLSTHITQLMQLKPAPEQLREAIELISNILDALAQTLDTLEKPTLQRARVVEEKKSFW